MVLETRTTDYAAGLSFQHLHWQDSVDHGLRAIELATDGEDLLARTDHYWTTISFLRLGNLDAARPLALSLRDRAEGLSTRRRSSGSGFVPITYLSCLEGDWKAGRNHSGQGLELATLSIQLLAPRALLEYQTGESTQGELYLERLETLRRSGPGKLQTSSRISMVIPTIARITGVPERLEIAEESTNTVLSEPSVRPALAISAKAGLALLAVLAGRRFCREGELCFSVRAKSAKHDDIHGIIG